MDENNNGDAKRSRTSTRSPAMRTPGAVLSADDSSERSRSEHSVELTLPPKKSSKHYNRRTAKNGASAGGGVSASVSANSNTNNNISATNGRSSSSLSNSAGSGGGGGGMDSTSDKENFCDRDKLMGETITGDGPYQQMRLPDGQMVLMLQPHYMQLAAALGINTHDGMNQMMDFESLIELSRKHQIMVSGAGERKYNVGRRSEFN